MRHTEFRTTLKVYGDVVAKEMSQAHPKVVVFHVTLSDHAIAKWVKTWRSTQSGANHSPPKFPANSENTGIFGEFAGQKACPILRKVPQWKELSRKSTERNQRIFQSVTGIFFHVCSIYQRSRLSCLGSRWKSELPALFYPARRDVSRQLLECEIARLSPLQNGFNDVGRQECTRKNPSNVALGQPSSAAECSLI